MREIKHRVWTGQEMKYDELYITLDGRLEYDGKDCSRLPVMQYTGLKDKNGVEIYEGDILEVDNGHWNNCTIKECAEHLKDIITVEYTDMTDDIEVQTIGFYMGLRKQDNSTVIGNIYENPELLK